LIQVGVYALAVTAYSTIPLWLELHSDKVRLPDLPSNIHAALGIVLGWLLSFRTNVSYARWWEARTLWGALVNASRNMAIKVADLVRAEQRELAKFRIEIVGFSRALLDHLRDGADVKRLPGFADCVDSPSHVPMYLVTRMYESLNAWHSEGFIDGHELIVLDEEARKFMDICGGCERIRNTRLIRSYRTFARQCVVVYLLTFPWGMVHDFGWWTIPLTAIIAYFMIGLEIVAEHVEEPFGHDEDDLDLENLCRTIETTVNELFDRRAARDAVLSGSG
jgi:putative membrane protein